jgi:hypothetical protein
MIVALEVKQKWKLGHLNVKTTILNDNLDEKVIMI